MVTERLWETVKSLKGKLEPSQYKYVVLPLIFLKYYSDKNDTDIWKRIVSNASRPDIATVLDKTAKKAGIADFIPKPFSSLNLPSDSYKRLISVISKLGFGDSGHNDVLGRVYEYFVAKFAEAEGRSGGEFYTPEPVVKLLVALLEPHKGKIYDPACGSGGMFVQSAHFLNGGYEIYGQEIVETSWKICRMNLAIRGMPYDNIALGNTLLDDKFPDLKADYILANPPFNLTKWGADKVRTDPRWKFGIPDNSKSGANYAWIQHIIYHLADDGKAGFVMPNISLTIGGKFANTRKGILNSNLVDCIISLPKGIFQTTNIASCIWIIDKTRKERNVLFINTDDVGEKTRERIVETYRAWKSGDGYEDVVGFCKSAKPSEIRDKDYDLNPERYVDSNIVEVKEFSRTDIEKLKAELLALLEESDRLHAQLRRHLDEIC